jgi:hypothetical protein
MLATAVIAYMLTAPPRGPRSIKQFDPGRVAAFELRTWQAYNAGNRLRLFAVMTMMLREQDHYSWIVAAAAAFDLARAELRFRQVQSNDDRVVRSLEAVYAHAQSWLHADFDPAAVAHAELAWWVASRAADADGTEHAGDLMADEYAIVYGTPRDLVIEAAQLRAEAAALRDARTLRPDWTAIGRLLEASYASLSRALSTTTAKRLSCGAVADVNAPSA